MEDVPSTSATREPPSTVSEVLKGLQRCFSDPQDPPGRLGIDIRRKMLITDAMKEAKKKSSALTRNSRYHSLGRVQWTMEVP